MSAEEQIEVSPYGLRIHSCANSLKPKASTTPVRPLATRVDRYIWRYVKPDQQTLTDEIDELE